MILQREAAAVENGQAVAMPARICKPEPGDLRGIPAIGRGVSGASPGTRPDVDGVNRADRAMSVEPMVAFL